MGEYAAEYLVKAWENAAKPRGMGLFSIVLNSSGRFFISTVAGDIISPDTGIPIVDIETIADKISAHIDDNEWNKLPIEEIAKILSDEISDLKERQKKWLVELEIKLIVNIIDGEEESEATARINIPEVIKPLVIA